MEKLAENEANSKTELDMESCIPINEVSAQEQCTIKEDKSEDSSEDNSLKSSTKTEAGTANDEPHTSKKRSGRKRCYAPHADEHNLYGYNKKKILDYLKVKGCNAGALEKHVRSFKINLEETLNFFNHHVEQAQQHVFEECDSLSFSNINDWLQLFKSWKLPEQCNYEPAIVTNTIANNEKLPSSEELQGIDLKSIYKFLGNALLGLPQNELNVQSAHFLAREFESLIDEANTPTGDAETKHIKDHLKEATEARVTQRRQKLSLDPLWLDNNFA